MGEFPKIKSRSQSEVSPWMSVIEREVAYKNGTTELYHAVGQQDYVGIVALTPLFTHQLGVQQAKVQQQGMTLLLDSPLPITTRLGLGGQLSGLVESANGRIPNISAAFANAPTDPQQLAAWNALEASLQQAIRNAGTAAAAWPFLAAASLVLLALVPIAIGRRHLDL